MAWDPHNFDTVLDLCRDEHRRIVLAVLAEEQRPLTLDDLTEAIVEYNHQSAVTEVAEEVLTEIQISLHHTHLPKLESAEVIAYDPQRKRVEPTVEFDELQPSLATIIDADPGLEEPIDL